LYLAPEAWTEKTSAIAGVDFEYLSIARDEIPEVVILSQPATRFHGAVPAMIEEVRNWWPAARK